MRKPNDAEKPKQSKAQEANEASPRTRKQAESPNRTKTPKRIHIIPLFIALSVLVATNRTASAISMSFNLYTDKGNGSGTLTLSDSGADPNDDGYEVYAVDGIAGTFAGQPITGLDDGTFIEDNLVEVDDSGEILTDSEGIGFNTGSPPADPYTYDLHNNTNGFAITEGLYYTDATGIDYGGGIVTSFTQIPFQAPLADAIPVIGSVLVLGALRKVRNFKKA